MDISIIFPSFKLLTKTYSISTGNSSTRILRLAAASVATVITIAASARFAKPLSCVKAVKINLKLRSSDVPLLLS